MPEKRIKYKSDSIEISFAPKLCIHAAECANGLPDVFDPNKKPWVDPNAAEVQEIVDVIEKCPSGALKYQRFDGSENEKPGETIKIITVPNGPLYVSGDIKLTNSDGEEINETRVALCRCGASKNKPLCDNTHLEVNFNAD
ncbi:MAG: hypothetical protein HND52_14835 [Ignavibacteriae bacterium]|nr:hypothetical protein [Ignavibacteriota bacterium]NOG99230.1 hypothetical protein [Ignavibacteriota bacterium]